MAVSLGFGIVFATGIILLLVPAMTMWQHDVTAWVKEKVGSGEEPEVSTFTPATT